jgi:hypothetical protein
MTKRYCQTGRIECPHLPACGVDCHFDIASQKKIYTFTEAGKEIKEDDGWRNVGQVMIGAVLAMLFVFFALLLFAGFHLYSLL